MTILPLSTPGRSTPNSQHSSYFPPSSSSSNGNNNGPTIGLPGQAGFRRKSDGGYGFNGSSASARVHGHHHQSSSMSSFVPLFLRRLFRFPHMDFQVQPKQTFSIRKKGTRPRIRSRWKAPSWEDINVRVLPHICWTH